MQCHTLSPLTTLSQQSAVCVCVCVWVCVLTSWSILFFKILRFNIDLTSFLTILLPLKLFIVSELGKSALRFLFTGHTESFTQKDSQDQHSHNCCGNQKSGSNTRWMKYARWVLIMQAEGLKQPNQRQATEGQAIKLTTKEKRPGKIPPKS